MLPMHEADDHTRAGGDEPAGFSAGELAVVCAHYDLGEIEAVWPMARGSGRSPKALLQSRAGWYLLKRRARGLDHPARVAFSHAVMLHLASRGFPAPQLVGTRTTNNSMLVRDDAVYELFRFVAGRPYDGSVPATIDAGRRLAQFHRLAAELRSPWEPAPATYRDAVERPGLWHRLEQRLGRTAMLHRVRALAEAATDRLRRLGADSWSAGIIHGDWHPGNMLFSRGRVTVVVDFDAVGRGAMELDLACGALQFSMPRRPMSAWGADLDRHRLAAFCRGWQAEQPVPPGDPLARALPWLMLQCMLAEVLRPIAADGRFGGIEPAPAIERLHQLARNLAGQAEAISAMLSHRGSGP